MGVSKSDNNIDMSVLEDCVRDTLGTHLHSCLSASMAAHLLALSVVYQPSWLVDLLCIHLHVYVCASVHESLHPHTSSSSSSSSSSNEVVILILL